MLLRGSASGAVRVQHGARALCRVRGAALLELSLCRCRQRLTGGAQERAGAARRSDRRHAHANVAACADCAARRAAHLDGWCSPAASLAPPPHLVRLLPSRSPSRSCSAKRAPFTKRPFRPWRLVSVLNCVCLSVCARFFFDELSLCSRHASAARRRPSLCAGEDDRAGGAARRNTDNDRRRAQLSNFRKKLEAHMHPRASKKGPAPAAPPPPKTAVITVCPAYPPWQVRGRRSVRGSLGPNSSIRGMHVCLSLSLYLRSKCLS